MHALRTVALALALGLPATLGSAPPAGADYTTSWGYDSRPAGQPTTGVAAQTLSSAHGSVDVDYYHGRVSATVVLGDTPVADTDARLHLAFGTATDTGCAVAWEQSWSTFVPEPGATRDGATLTLQVPLAPVQGSAWTCSFVAVTGADNTATLDRLDGTSSCCVIGDPPTVGAFLVSPADPVALPVGKWRAVRFRLEVAHYVEWIDLVPVDSPRVKARTVSVHVTDERPVVVWIPMKLLVHRRAVVKVGVRSWMSNGEPTMGSSQGRVEVVPRS